MYELTAICTWLLVVDCAACTRIDGTLCIPCVWTHCYMYMFTCSGLCCWY